MANKDYTGGVVKHTDEASHSRVQWMQSKFTRYEDFWQPDLARYTNNARALWGINFGQWHPRVVEEMRKQGRKPKTHNIILDKVEKFIGNMLSNGYDVRYSPAQGNIDSLVLKLQDMYYSDEALMEWGTAETEVLWDSMAGVGYESMQISNKYHDLGNIAWVKRNPRRILLDPTWKSTDVDLLKNYFTWGRFTVDQICDLFPIHSERIKDLKDREAKEGIDYGENEGGVANYDSTYTKWADDHLVYEYHFIEKKKREWEFDRKNNCPFPETNEPFGSPADRAQKYQYIQLMGLRNEDITFVTQDKVTKYIQACCPTLDSELVLLDGKDLIQVGNCNLFPLGLKSEGQYMGYVDRVMDLQQSYNKRQNWKEDIMMTAARGKVIMDESLAGTDGEKKTEIQEQYNKPNDITWVQGLDMGGKNMIIPINATPIANDIFQMDRQDLEEFDRFIPGNAATDGRMQHSREPNSMFQSKIEVGQISMRLASTLWESHKKRKAMAYAKQAKITYAGTPRDFGNKSGVDSSRINDIQEQPDGSRKILDNIALLPDVKVTMVQSKDGVNIRTQTREDLGQLAEFIGKDPNNRLASLVIAGEIIDTVALPDESKESIKKAFDLMIQAAGLDVIAHIKQSEAALNPKPAEPPPPKTSITAKISELPPDAVAPALKLLGIETTPPQPPAQQGQPPVNPIAPPTPQQSTPGGMPPENEMKQGTPQQG
jgi:hypothetical protein